MAYAPETQKAADARELALSDPKHNPNSYKVFDWTKAAEIIKEKQCKEAMAGLDEDWYWTADYIVEDGKAKVKNGCFLASNWATPVLDIEGERVECWFPLMKSERHTYDANGFWPKEALQQSGLEPYVEE